MKFAFQFKIVKKWLARYFTFLFNILEKISVQEEGNLRAPQRMCHSQFHFKKQPDFMSA